MFTAMRLHQYDCSEGENGFLRLLSGRRRHERGLQGLVASRYFFSLFWYYLCQLMVLISFV